MALKLTYGILKESYEALKLVMANPNYSDEMKSRMARLGRKIQVKFGELEDEVRKVQAEITEKTSSISDSEKAAALKNSIATAKTEELFDRPIEIEAKPIKLSKVAGCVPAPNVLLQLDWFFEDDITSEEDD